MNLPSKTQLISNYSDFSLWNGDLFGSHKTESTIDQLLCKGQQVTELNEDLLQGFWRINQFIQNDFLDQPQQNLLHNHLTSFQENIIESHGKNLKETLEIFLGNKHKTVCEKLNNKTVKQIEFCEEDDLEGVILSIPDLKQEIKASLICHTKNSFDCYQIIKSIVKQIKSQFLPEALTICEGIINEYNTSEILSFEEQEIGVYIWQNYISFSNTIKVKLPDDFIDFQQCEGQKDFYELVRCWMKNIFYALNGIYDDKILRPSALEELKDCKSSKKMRKLV